MGGKKISLKNINRLAGFDGLAAIKKETTNQTLLRLSPAAAIELNTTVVLPAKDLAGLRADQDGRRCQGCPFVPVWGR